MGMILIALLGLGAWTIGAIALALIVGATITMRDNNGPIRHRRK